MNKAYTVLLSAAAGAAFVGYITPKQIEIRAPQVTAAPLVAQAPRTTEEALANARDVLARAKAIVDANKYGCTVNLAQYQGVKTGMTYAQVSALLGCDGTETAQSPAQTLYMWRGNDLGASLNIAVTSGKVTSKAQFGLK
jgi:hypothetical protein